MSKRDRKTLKSHFSDGSLPTQEHFADLIDSMVNMVEDGFEKTPMDGLKIAQLDSGKLISFYETITIKEPQWSIAFSASGYGSGSQYYKNLNIFYGGNNASGLTLASVPSSRTNDVKPAAQEIRMGINQNHPQHELDVNGVIASHGRLGKKGEAAVLADGKWHPVRSGLKGCQAFEVMAGVGKRLSGRYALLHAFALNTFNSKRSSINRHQAHYSSRCDQIDLRWSSAQDGYALEMRTRCQYCNSDEKDEGKKIFIRYYITELWFDHDMSDCVINVPGNGGKEQA